MRSYVPAVGCLALAVTVAFVHDHLLTRRERERVAEVSQLQSLARQLADARQALHDLERLGDEARAEVGRVAKLEESLHSIGSQLTAFDERVDASTEALRQLETRAAQIENRTTEERRQTTRVVEAVQADLSSRLRNAEGRFEKSIERLASLEAATREERNLEAMRKHLLAPIVQICGDDTVGSGVLLFSGKNPDGKHATIVISSYHVIRNILSESGSSREKGIKVLTYADGAPADELAEMVAHDESTDLVLLRLRGSRVYPDVARLMPADRCERLTVFTPIYAVGCPLGNDPVPTSGELSSLTNRVGAHNYWMINAPTYFGNSGGGVFHGKTHELIGVFSKIYTHGSGRPIVIPHMGLATPAATVAEFVRRTGHGYALEPASEAPAR